MKRKGKREKVVCVPLKKAYWTRQVTKETKKGKEKDRERENQDKTIQYNAEGEEKEERGRRKRVTESCPETPFPSRGKITGREKKIMKTRI